MISGYNIFRKLKWGEFMSRKNMIINYFKTQAINAEKFGINTSFLAEKLQLSRQNVSSDLNELVGEGILQKSSGRPVKYWLETNSQNQKLAFKQLIGYDGSLKRAVEIAKASIIYPPSGLNTIISGPSGAGKSFLADIMFQYAKETSVIEDNAPFIIFNCADYANNPQLLMSQLFGHSKGAFTGAESDSEGIIKKGNNGVIFLDEVHRLPPEGQEMLFLLIDKGYFYKLGNPNEPYHVNVRIIAATSMNTEDSLLTTFIRRFPTQIVLPALEERPIAEKQKMIHQYFQEEANHLGVSLSISPSYIVALLLFNPKGNVGELRNIIRLSCAKAFLSYVSSEKIDDFVHIYITHLPSIVQITYFDSHKNINEIEEMVGFEDKIFFHMDCEDTVSDLLPIERSSFETLITNYLSSGLGFNEVKKLLKSDIVSFMNYLKKAYPTEQLNYSPNILNFVHSLGEELNCSFQNDFTNIIAIYIDYLSKMNAVDFSQEDEKYLQFFDHSNYQSILKYLSFLEIELGRSLATVECITLFYFLDYFSINSEHEHLPQIIVVCHGDSTASSLVNVAKKLINYENLVAIDMSLDSSIKATYKIISNMLKRSPKKQEILLIVDMGSLKLFKDQLSKEFDLNIGLIDMATTLTVMEACKMAKYNNNISAEEIAQSISENYYIDNLVAPEKQKIILTSCMTGQGTARRLANFIEEYLIHNQCKDIRVLPYDSVTNFPEFESYNELIAVVGTINPHLSGVPFIGIERFFFEEGTQVIQSILSNDLRKLSEYESNEQIATSSEAKKMAEKFVFDSLDEKYRKLIIDSVLQTFSDLEEIMSFSLSPSQAARYIIHYSFCLERLLLNDPIIECAELKNILLWHDDLFNTIKTVSTRHLPKTVPSIPNEELGYIVQIFI